IPLEDRKYLGYAPLRKAAFVGNAATVNFLADLKDGIYRAEADPDGTTGEFFRRLEIVDAGEETPPNYDREGAPCPTAVSLFLTTACNLRCTYCYASAGDTVRESMPLDVAKRGIDYVVANAVRQKASTVELNYHGGGEPTVNWRTLTYSFNHARRRTQAAGLELNASTATNGMLTDRQIDWITAHLQGASLSCDGLPEAQDRHRVRPSGRGSSARVIHTLRRFDEAGFNYGIRMTATAELIPFMADSVDYLFSSFRTHSVQIEPAYQIGRYADQPSAETEAFLTAFREAQRRAKKHGKQITYSGARVGILTNHFCAVSQDSFALLPDGAVSSCFEACSHSNPHASVFLYGQPDEASDGYRFDMERLGLLRRQGVQRREHCRECFAKWTCAGDCFHKAVVINGSAEEFAGTGRCHINRELTKDQILDRIAEAGGVCWHELPNHLREKAYRELGEREEQKEQKKQQIKEQIKTEKR
ncbi:MAG: radical SAM protein, partial [Tannerella sp.]|nr:radical SAM protein [Tannerella sp.]